MVLGYLRGFYSPTLQTLFCLNPMTFSKKIQQSPVTGKVISGVCLEHSEAAALSEVFLEKCVLKICRKFTWEHPCRSVISIKKFLCNIIEIALRYGCSLTNLLHIFRTPFYKNTFGELLLNTHILAPGKLKYNIKLDFI